jgi:hypothetical protein
MVPFLCRHEENHFDHSFAPHDVPLGHFSARKPLATCVSYIERIGQDKAEARQSVREPT